MSRPASSRPASRGPLERFLGLFTEVRGGEGGTALLLLFNIFLILTAYYIIKPVREALILAGGGAEVKSYAAAGQALLLLLAVPVYGWLAGRMPRRALINGVSLFFIACLWAFYAAAQLKVAVGVVFFLWVGVFNLMVVAQFWSFANDVYSVDEGKRLFPLVAFGASSGAVLGSVITKALIKPIGVYQLLLVASGLLFAALILTNLVDRRERARAGARAADAAPDAGTTNTGSAFGLVWRNRYLLTIAFMILCLNLVNTTGEYILGKTVASAADAALAAGTADGLDKGGYIGRFYADFFGVVNVLGLVLQLFVVSRAIKFLGVRVAVLILPAIALGSYALLSFLPILAIVRWAKTAENATDYSLQNTVRNVLFLPTTREEKYKAKQVIDAFFVRAGDVLSAVLVYAGTTWLSFQTGQFALANFVIVVAWLVLAVAVGRRYARLTGEGAEVA